MSNRLQTLVSLYICIAVWQNRAVHVTTDCCYIQLCRFFAVVCVGLTIENRAS